MENGWRKVNYSKEKGKSREGYIDLGLDHLLGNLYLSIVLLVLIRARYKIKANMHLAHGFVNHVVSGVVLTLERHFLWERKMPFFRGGEETFLIGKPLLSWT